MTTRKSKVSAVMPDLQNLAVDPAISAFESLLRMTAVPVRKKIKGRKRGIVSEYSSGKTEQEQYNEALVSTNIKLAPTKRVKVVLEESINEPYDPIENAMKRFPTLTREQAEEMAKAFGF